MILMMIALRVSGGVDAEFMLDTPTVKCIGLCADLHVLEKMQLVAGRFRGTALALGLLLSCYQNVRISGVNLLHSHVRRS